MLKISVSQPYWLQAADEAANWINGCTIGGQWVGEVWMDVYLLQHTYTTSMYQTQPCEYYVIPESGSPRGATRMDVMRCGRQATS